VFKSKGPKITPSQAIKLHSTSLPIHAVIISDVIWTNTDKYQSKQNWIRRTSNNSETIGTIMKTGCIQRMGSICPPKSLTQKWRIGISNQTANDFRGDCLNASMMGSCKCAALFIFYA